MYQKLAPILVLGGAMSACALPSGSKARPVAPVAQGRGLVGGGVSGTFAVAGSSLDGDSSFRGTIADLEDFVLIPALSFDYALKDGTYLGVEVSSYTDALSSVDFRTRAYFINPRFETRLTDQLALTVDGNIGLLDVNDVEDLNTVPFFAPTVGLRGYIPTGFGGVILSQQVGTGLISVTLPGSLAYDVPIPLGDRARLHVFPEVSWDPTFLLIGDGDAFLALFSAGLSLMLEL